MTGHTGVERVASALHALYEVGEQLGFGPGNKVYCSGYTETTERRLFRQPRTVEVATRLGALTAPSLDDRRAVQKFEQLLRHGQPRG